MHSLVKKGKLKEVASYIESLQNKDLENENKEVLQFMESGKRPVGLGAHYDFFNSTMNRFSSITIMVHFIMPFSTFFYLFEALLFLYYSQNTIRSRGLGL